MTHKHSVFYFNDRQTPAMLYRDTLSNWICMLPPAQGREVEIEIEPGAMTYIKVWETNVVLIGSMDPNAVIALRVQQE